MAEIAIVGMAGRFPGAKDVDEFWRNLCAGVESVRDVSDEELKQAGPLSHASKHKHYVRKTAFPDNVENFDSQFFGMTPSEAAITDPQHRLLLECAHEALEDAGYDADRYAGMISVFAGGALNTYLLTRMLQAPEAIEGIDLVQLNLASSHDFLTTRVSYKLGLRGISHTVQCACATSLAAVHLACQNLLAKESDMALAGGVALNFRLRYGYPFSAGGIFSAQGQCRAFDSHADGTVFGNGAGVVVLKRYDDALRDHDHVHAIIRGSAANNDGCAKAGYAAPSLDGQALVMAEALANAGVSPEDVGYVETHGTGTPIGDPIETQALTRAYQRTSGRKNICAIGSVKPNIGHLDCAAGVASLIKVVKILEHGIIPPSLNFRTPNPLMTLEDTSFQVNTKLRAWSQNNVPRRAGVSAFGVGGTNVHAVLEEAVQLERQEAAEPYHLMVYSALTEPALEDVTARVHARIHADPQIDRGDAAFTLAVGRKQLPYRRFQIIQNQAERAPHAAVTSRVFKAVPSPHPPVVFMFAGQGAHVFGVGRELYDRESAFRKALDSCFTYLADHMDRDPCDLLFSSPDPQRAFNELHQHTGYVQPLLFSLEYALSQLWESWGIQPSLMVGHSLGEYVAACVGGTMSLDHALKLIVRRGQLMQSTQEGAMLSVPLSFAEAAALTTENVALAAVNSADQSVLSGAVMAIEYLQAKLEADGVQPTRLPVQRAFHSPLMNPIVEQFRECVNAIPLQAPRIPWTSNVSGTRIKTEQAVDPEYWVQHLRNTVLFHENLKEAHLLPNAILLEVGTGQVLRRLANRLPLATRDQIALSSLSGCGDGYASLLSAAGTLWARGVPVDWQAFYKEKNRSRISLPTYPFERQRCWIGNAESYAPAQAGNSIPNHVEQTAPMTRTSLAARPHLANDYVAPSTATELALVSILEPLFGFSPLGIRDNFFSLGADSLLSLTVTAQLKEHFGLQLTAVHLYEALDTASLAEIIDEMARESPQTPATHPSPVSQI
jgi:phthiocerol/phenolphthiocerol synthesis type-I polyketide synthase E